MGWKEKCVCVWGGGQREAEVAVEVEDEKEERKEIEGKQKKFEIEIIVPVLQLDDVFREFIGATDPECRRRRWSDGVGGLRVVAEVVEERDRRKIKLRDFCCMRFCVVVADFVLT